MNNTVLNRSDFFIVLNIEMNIEYVDTEQIEEPITIDHTVEIKCEKPKNKVKPIFNLDMISHIKPRYKPIEKKPKSKPKPIKVKVPIHQATFATLEDYLAAMNA